MKIKHKLLDALRNTSKKIESDMEDSKLFTHTGQIGTFRENIIQKFIRPFLPDCYSIGSGQIFDQKDNMSKQIDLVLYDQLFSNVLFKNNETKLFPFESVYGTIEIKSMLTSDELVKSIDNIISVKELEREDSDMMDIMPHIGNLISKSKKNLISYDTDKANNLLGVVFCYDGISKEKCIEKLNEMYKKRKDSKQDTNHLPDFIFNWKKGYMITKGELKSGGYWLALRKYSGKQEFDGYFSVNTEADTLVLFYLTLNTFLNEIRLKAINLLNYWNIIFKESIKR